MTDQSLISALSALGLETEEAQAYIFLVGNGAADVTSIAKHLSITRVTAYLYIEALLKNDCISKVKIKKRQLYQAHDPMLLLSRFEKIFKEGSQSLSILSLTHKESNFVPEITMHNGLRQISAIYDDVAQILPKGGTFFRYTSRLKDVGYSPLYARLRKEKEIERLVITSEKKGLGKSKDTDRFIKTVPKDFAFDDNVTVLIYGSKISYIDFNSDTGIVIESPHLARFQEKIFKLLWRKL